MRNDWIKNCNSNGLSFENTCYVAMICGIVNPYQFQFSFNAFPSLCMLVIRTGFAFKESKVNVPMTGHFRICTSSGTSIQYHTYFRLSLAHGLSRHWCVYLRKIFAASVSSKGLNHRCGISGNFHGEQNNSTIDVTSHSPFFRHVTISHVLCYRGNVLRLIYSLLIYFVSLSHSHTHWKCFIRLLTVLPFTHTQTRHTRIGTLYKSCNIYTTTVNLPHRESGIS